jgi:hypothetical protein
MSFAEFKYIKPGPNYGRVVKLPTHFANSKLGKNYELIEEDYESDKVVFNHAPASLQRAAWVIREDDPEDTEVEESAVDITIEAEEE